jgi:hypothetical protein
MSSLATGYRTSERRESRSPVQIASLVIGVWWAANGIGALVIDANFATARVHGGGDLLGLAVTVNGWHALFHLLPGFAGILAARRARAALAYLLVAGAGYSGVGGWGLIAGGASIGVIAADATGDLVHLIEGLVTFAAGLLTLHAGRVRSS